MLMAGTMALSMTACGGASDGAAKTGVSMPTQSLQRWNQDGSNMKEQLEAAGYEVDLQYAGDNDIPTQVSQIENMIAGGCDALVIAAIDRGPQGCFREQHSGHLLRPSDYELGCSFLLRNLR